MRIEIRVRVLDEGTPQLRQMEWESTKEGKMGRRVSPEELVAGTPRPRGRERVNPGCR